MGINKKIEKAILKTLIYSDIFSYPLTKEEIWKYLIWEEKTPVKKREFEENFPYKFILIKENFYFLNNKEEIIELRKKRKKYSLEKKEISETALNILKKIPLIKLIGISGALSMENSEKEDDIDLFIITKKNTLWMTRLIATFFLEINKLRRHPWGKIVANKICLNMFVDEANLEIPKKEQNLYTAHEVCQMKPIFKKNDTYKKFLSNNQWILNYLPNSILKINKKKPPKNNFFQLTLNFVYTVNTFVFTCALCTLNFIFMLPQIWYMKSHQTKEILNRGYIRFHPDDKTNEVLNKYSSNIKKLFTYFHIL